jgi:hypothetical protein
VRQDNDQTGSRQTGSRGDERWFAEEVKQQQQGLTSAQAAILQRSHDFVAVRQLAAGGVDNVSALLHQLQLIREEV